MSFSTVFYLVGEDGPDDELMKLFISLILNLWFWGGFSVLILLNRNNPNYSDFLVVILHQVSLAYKLSSSQFAYQLFLDWSHNN